MERKILEQITDVLKEKQLAKDIVVSAIESAMVSAYRRVVGASTAQHVEAKLDSETGIVTVYAEKEVVEDNVTDARTEVLLDEARKVNPEVQPGDMLIVESTPADFGRVAAQKARQVIQQRIREAERSNQMTYYERQVGEIVTGLVQAINAQGVTVGLDMKAEGVMPNNQKIPGERLKLHDRVRAVVMEVKDGTRGPQIVLSRAHRNFLRRLLENEVPEIYHGIVEIRAISREPGVRAKVAVSATQPGIDPVGACVGIKGVRIQAIVKELHDEKIDIIQWDQDPVVYIQKAISPARVNGVYLADNEGARTATVVVGEDQLSLAIGHDGQNARLAAKLTGWHIDIKSITEAAGDELARLRSDESLSSATSAVEAIPQIEDILARNAKGRPVTPGDYDMLFNFVDHVKHGLYEQRHEEQIDRPKISVSIPDPLFQESIVLSYLDEERHYLTADDLISNLGVYLKALCEIQEIIDILLKHPPKKVRIVQITQKSPVNVTLDGGGEAIRLIRESISPWRKRHAEVMSQLEEQTKLLEIEKARASILETRANAAKTRAEEENVRSEAAKKYQEAESLRLVNEKLQLEIQKEKIELLISIVNQFAQELSEEDKFLYMTKLLGPVGIILESKYRIGESK